MGTENVSNSTFEHGDGGGGDGNTTNYETQIMLNVYDLTPLNHYTYLVGVGIFHSGIEVHGMEYGFGAHDFPVSGVFEVEPKSCPGFIYRCSIPLGRINMAPSEFRMFIESIASDYHGDTYHLMSKNCNHFTDDISWRLTGRQIPVLCAVVCFLKAFKYLLLNSYLSTMHVQKKKMGLSPSHPPPPVSQRKVMMRIKISTCCHRLLEA
uniref:Putative PPPDE thiol peptidase family protein isoform 2 n=1 Tax=Davidia involucrata TaxID=16924 RepID=A0A5B6ZYJ6_DAVIN